eukprot:scaffold2899_cov106-Isochrysis_galbana.AAC.8
MFSARLGLKARIPRIRSLSIDVIYRCSARVAGGRPARGVGHSPRPRIPPNPSPTGPLPISADDGGIGRRRLVEGPRRAGGGRLQRRDASRGLLGRGAHARDGAGARRLGSPQGPHPGQRLLRAVDAHHELV